MARNPKSDIVHKHNGLLGSVAFARSGMQSVVGSSSVSEEARTMAYEIWQKLDELQIDLKTNPKY